MKITKIAVGLTKKLQESRFEPVTFSITLEAEIRPTEEPDIAHLELRAAKGRLFQGAGGFKEARRRKG